MCLSLYPSLFLSLVLSLSPFPQVSITRSRVFCKFPARNQQSTQGRRVVRPAVRALPRYRPSVVALYICDAFSLTFDLRVGEEEVEEITEFSVQTDAVLMFPFTCQSISVTHNAGRPSAVPAGQQPNAGPPPVSARRSVASAVVVSAAAVLPRAVAVIIKRVRTPSCRGEANQSSRRSLRAVGRSTARREQQPANAIRMLRY